MRTLRFHHHQNDTVARYPAIQEHPMLYQYNVSPVASTKHIQLTCNNASSCISQCLHALASVRMHYNAYRMKQLCTILNRQCVDYGTPPPVTTRIVMSINITLI